MGSYKHANDEHEGQTAVQIASALAYLMTEAEAAGLNSLASLISDAEAAAFEEARKGACLMI